MGNLDAYNALRKAPPSALKTIGGGRLKGFTDVNPQWRYEAMTKQFGPCGVGWKYEIEKLWLEPGTDGQMVACVCVYLFIKQDGEWGEAIPGIGGSMLISKESGGLHTNDEAYKMAVTDALSTAMKMVGVAADIYAGLWDGRKYKDAEAKGTQDYEAPPTPEKHKKQQASASTGPPDPEILTALDERLKEFEVDSAWVKQTLTDLQWADVGEYLAKTYKVQGKTVSEMLQKVNQMQLAHFIKELQDRKAKG